MKNFTFFAVSALLFAASTAVTIIWGCIHVNNGWHADARRLDNDNDMDAWAGFVLRGVIVSRDVGRDDDSNDDAFPDSHAAALSPVHRSAKE